MNLSALSSQPINAFDWSPRSIIIPVSLVGEPVTPLFNSIKLSLTTIFVVLTVVVAPFIVRSPLTTKLPLIVTRSAEFVVSITKIPVLSVELYEYAEPVLSTNVCEVAELFVIELGNTSEPLPLGVIFILESPALVVISNVDADVISIPPAVVVSCIASLPVPDEDNIKLEFVDPVIAMVKSSASPSVATEILLAVAPSILNAPVVSTVNVPALISTVPVVVMSTSLLPALIVTAPFSDKSPGTHTVSVEVPNTI